MKEKIKKKEFKSKEAKKRSVWKILSIIFISIFLLVVIASLIRLYHFKSAFKESKNEEIGMAKSVVYDYLASNGRNVSMDNITPFNRITRIQYNHSEKKLIGVMVSDGSYEEMFLVDVDSNEIMMHSTTEFFGYLNNTKKMPFKNPRFDKEDSRKDMRERR